MTTLRARRGASHSATSTAGMKYQRKTGDAKDMRAEPAAARTPSTLHRAEARADHSHPADAPVARLEVRLLLDEEATVRIGHAEAVADALAVGEGVALDVLERLDAVGVLEPAPEQDRQDVLAAGRVPAP